MSSATIASSSSASGRAAELQDYATSKLDPIVRPLLSKLFKEQPQDPLSYMIDYLTTLRDSAEDTGKLEEKESTDEQPDTPTNQLPVLSVSDDSAAPIPRGRRANRRAGISAEPMAPDADDKTPPRIIPKSDEDYQSIRAAVSNNFLFSSLPSDQMKLVLDAMEKQKFEYGATIIRQGEDGNDFFVLSSGQCDCFVGDRKVKTYVVGESFGELALMYNCPRAATIRVTSKDGAQVWAVDRATFRRVLMNSTASKRAMYESFLSGIPLLTSLDKYERAKVADALVEVVFNENDFIIKQGDNDDRFYMLEDGECVALKRLTPEAAMETEVMRYKRGGYFGELALITSQPRAASVKCVSPTCKVVSLDRASFTRLLGPCEEILKRNTELYKQVEARIAAGKQAAEEN